MTRLVMRVLANDLEEFTGTNLPDSTLSYVPEAVRVRLETMRAEMHAIAASLRNPPD